jgi:SOS-response transcriptional repressor LexA
MVRLLSHRGAQLALTPAAPDEREVILGPTDDFAIAGTVAAVIRPFHTQATPAET